MYLFFVYLVVVILGSIALYYLNDKNFDRSVPDILGLSLFVAPLIFVILSFAISLSSQKIITSDEKYDLIYMDGKFATLTKDGLHVLYKKDSLLVSQTYKNFVGDDIMKPYIEIIKTTTHNKWSWVDNDTTDYIIHFPKPMLNIPSVSVNVIQ